MTSHTLSKVDTAAGTPGWASVASMVTAALIGEYSLLIMPFIMLAMINSFGIDEGVAAQLVSTQLFSMAVAALVTSLVIARLNLTNVVLTGAIAVIIANGACATSSSVFALTVGRIITGLGEGTIMAAASAIIASSRQHHKVYSVLGVAVAIAAALALSLVPLAVEQFDQRATFWVLAGAPLLAVASAYWLPKTSRIDSSVIDLSVFRSIPALSMLIAFGALWFGAAALWVFAERIGSHQGLSLNQIGGYLAIGQLVGILGPIAAGRWGLRIGLRPATIMACLGMIVGGAAFVFAPTGAIYALGAALLSFFIMFLPPCFRSMMAEMDPVGRIVGASAGFYTIGFALAPILVVSLASAESGYSPIFVLSALFFLISAALAFASQHKSP